MNRILTIINIECHEFPQPICDVSVIPIPTFVDIQQLKKKSINHSKHRQVRYKDHRPLLRVNL